MTFHIAREIKRNALAFDSIEGTVDNLGDEFDGIFRFFPCTPQLAGRSDGYIAWIMTIGGNEELSGIEESWNAFSGLLVTNLLAASRFRRDVRALYLNDAERSSIPEQHEIDTDRQSPSLAHREFARYLEGVCAPIIPVEESKWPLPGGRSNRLWQGDAEH